MTVLFQCIQMSGNDHVLQQNNQKSKFANLISKLNFYKLIVVIVNNSYGTASTTAS